MRAKSDPRTERGWKSESEHERRALAVADTRTRFSYRRELEVRDVLPAIGIGITVGLVAFYLTGVFLQRTPLVPGVRPTRKTKALRNRGG